MVFNIGSLGIIRLLIKEIQLFRIQGRGIDQLGEGKDYELRERFEVIITRVIIMNKLEILKVIKVGVFGVECGVGDGKVVVIFY